MNLNFLSFYVHILKFEFNRKSVHCNLVIHGGQRWWLWRGCVGAHTLDVVNKGQEKHKKTTTQDVFARRQVVQPERHIEKQTAVIARTTKNDWRCKQRLQRRWAGRKRGYIKEETQFTSVIVGR